MDFYWYNTWRLEWCHLSILLRRPMKKNYWQDKTARTCRIRPIWNKTNFKNRLCFSVIQQSIPNVFINSCSGFIYQLNTIHNIWKEISMEKMLHHIGPEPILMDIFLISDWSEKAQVTMGGAVTLTSLQSGLWCITLSEINPSLPMLPVDVDFHHSDRHLRQKWTYLDKQHLK